MNLCARCFVTPSDGHADPDCSPYANTDTFRQSIEKGYLLVCGRVASYRVSVLSGRHGVSRKNEAFAPLPLRHLQSTGTSLQASDSSRVVTIVRPGLRFEEGLTECGNMPMDRAFEIRHRASRVRRLLSGRDFGRAEREIEEALEIFPEEAEILALAADVQRKMGRPREAQSYLKRAEASNPAHETVIAVGAEVAYDTKDYEKAARLHRHLIDRRPTAFHVSRFVQALNRLGRYEEASEAARTGLERFRDDPWLLRGLAAAEAKRGRTDEAARLYERVVELDPNDRFAYKELMRLRTAGRSPDEAASALKGLMRVGDRKKNPHLKTLTADRLRRAGKLREAVEEYEAALALEPANVYALAQAGFCYKRLGETEIAIDTLGKAFLADPADHVVRKTLESLCRGAKRLSYLVRLVEEALKLHPELKGLYGIHRRLTRIVRSETASS